MNFYKFRLLFQRFLILLVLVITSKINAQSVSFTKPATSSTNVSTLEMLYTIVEPLGYPDAININFTCTSGPCLTGSNPNFVLNMNSTVPSPGSIFTTSNLALGSNAFTTTATYLYDGIYSIYVDYIRPGTSNRIVSTTSTNVKFDATTLAPTLNSPSSNSTYSSQIPVSLTLGENYLSSSAKITFTNIAGTYSNTLNLINNTLSQTFTLTTSALLANSNVTSATHTNLPDDTYNMVLSYQDIYSHPAAIALSANMLIQTATPIPSLTNPSTGSVLTSNNTMAFSYNLPSAPLSGTAQLTLSPGGYNYTLPNQSGSGTYTITSNIPPDGTYTATVSYQDFLGNPVAMVWVPNIKLDHVTLAPIISSPLSNSVITGTATLTYTTPENALAGSKKLILSQNGTTITTLTISDVNSNTLGLNFKNLVTSSGGISSITGASILPDGNYLATLSYQDQYSNPFTSTAINLTIDSQTITPTLNSPVAGAGYASQIPVALTFGEPYFAGSAKIIFVNGSNQRITLTLIDNVLSQTFTISTRNVIGSNVVAATQTTIPDNVYSIILQYQDVYGNPLSNVYLNNILIQNSTPVPTITSPTTGTVFSNSTNIALSYSLPSAPLSGTAQLTLTPGAYSYVLPNQSGSGTYTITANLPPDGTYTATVSYQDYLGNPTATSAPLRIVFQRATPSPKIISPINNGYFSTSILFKDSIPVANLAGSKVLSILKNNGVITTIVLNNSLTDSIYFNLQRLSQSISNVQSISGIDSLTNGTYVLKLSYQDVYSHPAATFTDTINIDASPLIGVLSHQNNIVFGPFVETLTFNKPVNYISNNPIIPNIINSTPSASLGQLVANNNNTVFTFQVTPLQQGSIQLQSPFLGVAYDISGNASQIIGIDSIKYVDTTIILTPIISGNFAFCQGDSTTLTSTLANTYIWSTGATTRSIIVKQAGTYNVKTTYDNRVKGNSNNVVITINPIPSAPILSRDTANRLVANSNGISWYKEGALIADTTQQFKPTTGGTFTAKTNQNGCISALSNPYYYLVTDIINLSADEFIKLAPNPFINKLNFDFSIKGYQKLNIEVFDMATGTRVAAQQNLIPGSSIYLGQLASGTYVVKVTSNDLKISHQFKIVKL